MTAGTPSPRTVVEAFLDAEHPAPLDRVYDAANALGLEDQPVRLALRRLVAAGEVEQSGRGRRGTLTLTPAGAARLDLDRAALRLASAQDRGEAPWDGRWRLLSVSTPESQRHLRDALRRTLTGLGAAPAATGLLVSPHDLAALVPDAARAHLVLATATTFDLRGVTDPRAVAELLWPAAPTVARYVALDAAVQGTAADDDRSAAAVLARQLRLAHALEVAVRDDPLLPPELRPTPWPPARARARWREAWDRTAAHAPGRGPFHGWE